MSLGGSDPHTKLFMPSYLKNTNEQTATLSELVKKLSLKQQVNTDQEKIDVNILLDQISAQSVTESVTIQWELETLILYLSNHIAPTSGQLTVKACRALSRLLHFSGLTLSEEPLNTGARFLVNCVKVSQLWALPDLLKCMSSIFYNHGGLINHEMLDDLLLTDNGSLPRLVFSAQSDILVRKAALQCIESLCNRMDKSARYLDDYYSSRCLSIFLEVLKNKISNSDEQQECKLLIKALRGISNVMNNTNSSHMSLLGELLAALKAYGFYGRDDPNIDIPTCLQPTNAANVPSALLNQPSPRKPIGRVSKKKNKRTNRRRAGEADSDEEDGLVVKNRSNVDVLPMRSGQSGSDTELSDSEVAQGQLGLYQSRVRQYALTALYSLIKSTDRRVIFGYWTSFLPTTDQYAGTLVSIVHNDPSVKVKISALAAISAMVDFSKTSLIIATEREGNTTLPYTPFSVELGNIIKELHRVLTTRLTIEPQFILITQIIKCLATVMRNAPYQKLKPGLLTRGIKLVRPYLSHKDTNTRVAALTCMGAAVTIHAPLIEVSHILLPRTSEDEAGSTSSHEVSDYNSSNPGTPSEPKPPGHSGETTSGSGDTHQNLWLINTCSRCIFSSGLNGPLQLPIRVEALQVLGALASGYLTLIRGNLNAMSHILTESFSDPEYAIRLHAALTADSVAAAMRKHYDNLEDAEDKLPLAHCVDFWNTLLSGALIQALQSDSQGQLRSTCCDCLSNVGVAIFSALKMRTQLLCMTMLLGLASDSDHLVRGSAARALGVIVLFPCSRENVSFVTDAAQATIACSQDSEVNLRVKASWALANITDALVLNLVNDDIESYYQTLNDSVLIGLYKSAMAACDDADKAKYNGTRALGSLLRFTQSSSLENKEFTELVVKAVQYLVRNLSQFTMRVRWNACYALGNVFKNPLILQAHPSLVENVLTGLCLVMEGCKNFKVRIHAAQALMTPAERNKYGSHETFSMVWKYLIQAMEQAAAAEDFSDYKYVATLTTQLCELLYHLMSLIEVVDLNFLSAVLFGQEDNIRKFINTASSLPDDSKVKGHMDSLSQKKMDAGQSGVLTVLYNLTQPLAPPNPVMKSKFNPSYE